MGDTFTPRVGADTSSSKVDATSPAGRSRTPIVWGQGISVRPTTQSQPTYVDSRPSTSRNISQASVSDAISRLQREKATIQKKLDEVLEAHKEQGQRFIKLMQERDHLSLRDTEQRQTIQNLHKELGGDPDLVDSDEDDPYLLRKRATEADERLKKAMSEMHKNLLKKTKQERRDQAVYLMNLQKECKEQTVLSEKLRKERDDSRNDADDAHRGAISIFNEQKNHESHIQRLQAEIHRANSAVER